MRKEIRIFVQAVLISCYSTVLMICWHNYAFFLPDTKWTYFTLNVGWILNGGVNPFIYLVFNKYSFLYQNDTGMKTFTQLQECILKSQYSAKNFIFSPK